MPVNFQPGGWGGGAVRACVSVACPVRGYVIEATRDNTMRT